MEYSNANNINNVNKVSNVNNVNNVNNVIVVHTGNEQNCIRKMTVVGSC